jgi:hypothetical protein
VRLQQIHWQKIAVVRRKSCSIAKQCVSYLFLPIGAIKVVVGVFAAVVIAVYLSNRYYWDILAPSPSHHPANTG